jgi:hypothetical protein
VVMRQECSSRDRVVESHLTQFGELSTAGSDGRSDALRMHFLSPALVLHKARRRREQK